MGKIQDFCDRSLRHSSESRSYATTILVSRNFVINVTRTCIDWCDAKVFSIYAYSMACHNNHSQLFNPFDAFVWLEWGWICRRKSAICSQTDSIFPYFMAYSPFISNYHYHTTPMHIKQVKRKNQKSKYSVRSQFLEQSPLGPALDGVIYHKLCVHFE